MPPSKPKRRLIRQDALFDIFEGIEKPIDAKGLSKHIIYSTWMNPLFVPIVIQ